MRCKARRVNCMGYSTLRALLTALVVSLFSFSAAAAPAAERASPVNAASAEEGAAEVVVAPDSPRATMTDFRRLTRARDFAGAAKYLDLSKVDPNDGPLLAEHLKEVLNRRLWVDASKLSPESAGNGEDKQPSNVEELGTIRVASGKQEPVLLVRKVSRTGPRWVFSAETVTRIEDWYEHLESVWLSERLPKPLLKMGPRLLRYWQWIALVPLLLGAWAVSSLAARVSRRLVVGALSEKHAASAHRLHGPFTLALMVGVTYAALPWLGLYQPALQLLHRWCAAFLLIAAFWGMWRGIDLSRQTVSDSRWARESSSAHSLLSLGSRVAKFVLAAAAFLTVLSQLGYQATTVLAGLGIGGVALALAAQKTVENLFGTFSLAVDQPFREGDTIKVDGVEGVVEAVGLRSTRLRTADRTIITIPNGKLADMRVETVTRQDRLRFFCQLFLGHTRAAQLEDAREKIRGVLAAAPLVDQSTAAVRVAALTNAGINIEVAAMLGTTDGARFADAKERLLLGILRSVEEAGCRLAGAVQNVEVSSVTRSGGSSERPRDGSDARRSSSS
jgi:MscS family membrane protein